MKKSYNHPSLVSAQNIVALVPLAAIGAGIAAVGAAASAVATSVATVGVPLAAGYAVGRGVKSAMEIRPGEPEIPVLKKVGC